MNNQASNQPVVVKADIKPYTKKQLAALYNVTPRCFSTMIDNFKEAIGKKKGWYYNVKQIEIIFDKLGYPNAFLPDDLPEEIKEQKKKEKFVDVEERKQKAA